MSEIATLQEQIGNAAAQHRGLRELFEELGLDYYCEGDLTIDEAAGAAGLDVAVLQGRIENLAFSDAGPSWPDRSLAELIAYLETEHHGLARNLVFETGALFGEVCRAGNDSRLSSMRSAFRRLSEQLILHIEHEELTIFPTVLALEEAWTRSELPPPKLEGGIRTALSRIVLEHFEIGQRLREMHRNRVELQGLSGAPCARLFERLAELERHLHEYMNLENYVAFPRAIALEDALYKASPAMSTPA